MRKELDEQLCKEFPNLYRMRHGSAQETCMCWGFPDDGWFDIIYEASQKLEALILELPEEERERYHASQVKEKFSTIRFYMSAETKEMREVIGELEAKSAVTCELCGEPGEERAGGWIKVYCDRCYHENITHRDINRKFEGE